MSDDDQVVKLLGQLRDAVTRRIARLNRVLETEQQAITARVEQRKQLAWQLQLPNRLFTIYEEVQYYPHWARNCPENVCSLITEIDVKEKRETGFYHIEKQVRFFLKGQCYLLVFEERLSSLPEDDACYGSLTLAGNSGHVLFKERMTRYGGNHRISDIARSFQVTG
jgi:hypothetical protein